MNEVLPSRFMAFDTTEHQPSIYLLSGLVQMVSSHKLLLVFRSMLALCVMLVGIVPAHAADNSGKVLTVKVKESKLRSAPKLWASAVGDLKFGDVLTPLASDGGWFKVKTSRGLQGFVHPTAVTDRRVILSSSKAASAKVDPSEVVLAGKGFNKEIEQDFSKKHPASDYRKVDAVGAVKISDQELREFLRSGKLGKGEI